MVKRKNKFTKKALAFASAFIILCSVLIVPCLAQAPQIDFDYSNNYTKLITFSKYDNNVVFITVAQFDSSDDFTIYSAPDFIFTEYYYNELYASYGDSSVLTLEYDTFYYLFSTRYKYSFVFGTSFIDSYTNQIEALMGYNYLTINQVNSLAELGINNQFTYWQNEIEAAESNGYNNGYDVGSTDGYNEGYNNGFELGHLNGYNDGLSEGESIGYDSGYRVGRSDGYNSGLTQGYTNAINDKDLIADAFFEIFNAPFVFVQQIVPFEIFGINLFHIIAFFLIIALAIFMFKILRKVLPL